MARLVRFRVLEGIAVVTLDAPPVNALSAKLRAGLWDVIERIDANDDINGAVLLGSDRMFSAGADIREFAGAPAPPSLGQLCARIEGCTKPVIAAAQGLALGGGAEVMLAAHYRLASPEGRIGLPEVSLGLVPGAGGTQRLPRLIGADRALQMIVSANVIDAVAAHSVGLIDAVVKGDLASGAITFARRLVARGQGPRRTCDQRKHLINGRAHLDVIAKARETFATSPLHAVERAIDCIEVAPLLPFETALEFEGDAFMRCLDNPQSVALRHLFMAERKIDDALIERDGSAFRPVVPMGKAVVARLSGAMRKAADFLVSQGTSEAKIDSAMVAYGFRTGPFGGKQAGPENDQIARRLIAAMVVEGAACVAQQAVQRASDVDALAAHGLGFPRRKGGPMRAAQSLGLIELRKDMRVWAEDSEVWAVPELLDEAIKDARGFDAIGVLVLS